VPLHPFALGVTVNITGCGVNKVLVNATLKGDAALAALVVPVTLLVLSLLQSKVVPTILAEAALSVILVDAALQIAGALFVKVAVGIGFTVAVVVTAPLIQPVALTRLRI
jgi:hypothetical protein